MDNIPIVDAHHHLWDLENEKTKYSWLMVSEGEAFFGDYGACLLYTSDAADDQ